MGDLASHAVIEIGDALELELVVRVTLTFSVVVEGSY